MATGPGKYDDECTWVRLQTNAKAAIVIVIHGSKGNGFEVQGDPTVVLQLPELLETLAAQIRADVQT